MNDLQRLLSGVSNLGDSRPTGSLEASMEFYAPHPGPTALTRFISAWRHVESRLGVLTVLVPCVPERQRNCLAALVQRLNSEQAHLLLLVQQMPQSMVASAAFLETAIPDQVRLAQLLDGLIAEAKRVDLQPNAAASSPTPVQMQSVGQQLAELLDDVRRREARHEPLPYQVPFATSWHPPGVQQQPAARTSGAFRYGESDSDAHSFDRSGQPQPSESRSPAASYPFRMASLMASSMQRLGGLSLMLVVLVAVSGIAVADRIFGSISTNDAAGGESDIQLDSRLRPSTKAEKPYGDRLLQSPVVGGRTAVDRPIQQPVDPGPLVKIGDTQSRGEETSIPSVSEASADQPSRRASHEGLPEGNATVPRPEGRRGWSAQPPVEAAPPQMDVRMPVGGAPPSKRQDIARHPQGSQPPGAESQLYVPVLSTHKDAAAAQDTFAVLKITYGSVLGATSSEVQATGSAAGAWHRLVLIPATTKDAANHLCAQLRSAGYARCWVKPY